MNKLKRNDIKGRFFSKFTKTEGCWTWQGSLSHGYGMMKIGQGVAEMAHRVSFLIHKGLIPDDHEVHHICPNRSCVNPEHLTLLSTAQHVRTHHPRIIVCKHGHPFEGDNIYTAPDGYRECRECRENSRQKYKKSGMKNANVNSREEL